MWGTWDQGFSSERSKEDKAGWSSRAPQRASPETLPQGLCQGMAFDPRTGRCCRNRACIGNSQYSCPSEGLLTLGLPALDLGSDWRVGGSAEMQLGDLSPGTPGPPGATSPADGSQRCGICPLTDAGGALLGP